MKIANRQIWYLIGILRDTLALDAGIFSISHKDRLKLYNDITNQQDNMVREFPDEEVQGREASKESEGTG
jgi:hypothetical protein